MRRDEIMALEGKKLAEAVAEHVMGYERRAYQPVRSDLYMLLHRHHAWYPNSLPALPYARPMTDYGHFVPPYHADRNDLALAEAEIESRGLQDEYIWHLANLCKCKLGTTSFDAGDAWAIRTAPLDVCCRALLLAVMEAENA